jgi:hypothetical protein
MKQYLITKTITISFECEAKNEKDAIKQFNSDFEDMFNNTDSQLDEDQPENVYVAKENGEYVPVAEAKDA